MSKRFDPYAEPTPGEDERAQELLAQLGLAILNAQAVEYGLVSLLAAAAVRDNREVPGEQIRALMDTRFKQTMGRLLTDTARSVGLSADSAESLTVALDARNWLAHHFYRQFALAAFDERLRQRALALLGHARQIFERAQAVLHEEAIRVLAEAGIAEEAAAAGADEAMAKYLDSGSDPNELWSDTLKRKF